MQHLSKIAGLFLISITLSPLAEAAGALDTLFNSESGRTTAVQPAPTTPKRKATGNLDSLLEQEQADAARQRQLAEEQRQREAARQRQLAEQQRQQAEAQRLAAQQQQQYEAEAAAERKQRESVVNTGIFAAVMGAATGNRNFAATGFVQALTGQDSDLNQALENDVQAAREKQQRQAEALRLQREAAKAQQEAQRRQVADNNHRAAEYNQQQAADAHRQQEQQRLDNDARQHQAEARRAQDQQRQQQAERERKLQPVNSCVAVKSHGGKSYLHNDCAIDIEVAWRDQGDCSSGCTWHIGPGTYTSAGNGIRGHVEFIACQTPGIPNLSTASCH